MNRTKEKQQEEREKRGEWSKNYGEYLHRISWTGNLSVSACKLWSNRINREAETIDLHTTQANWSEQSIYEALDSLGLRT